jgi:hypothetical protein
VGYSRLSSHARAARTAGLSPQQQYQLGCRSSREAEPRSSGRQPLARLLQTDSLSDATARCPRGCSERPAATLTPPDARLRKVANRLGSASYLEMAKAVASSIGRWRVLDDSGHGSAVAASISDR